MFNAFTIILAETFKLLRFVEMCYKKDNYIKMYKCLQANKKCV